MNIKEEVNYHKYLELDGIKCFICNQNLIKYNGFSHSMNREVRICCPNDKNKIDNLGSIETYNVFSIHCLFVGDFEYNYLYYYLRLNGYNLWSIANAYGYNYSYLINQNTNKIDESINKYFSFRLTENCIYQVYQYCDKLKLINLLD